MTDSDDLPENHSDIPLLFIYIHGFNSKGDPDSPKIKELEKLGEVLTVDYDSFGRHDAIEAHLSDEIKRISTSRKEKFTVLAGTSLGGYWASVIGNRFGIPAILINPAFQPRKSLKKHIGIELKNFKDGEASTLAEDVPATYRDAPDAGKFLILLDKGDDIFDYRKTEAWFPKNPVVTFEGGSHPFEHMREALPEIRRFITNLRKVQQ